MIRAIAAIWFPVNENYHPIRIQTRLVLPSMVVTLIALPSLFLGGFSVAFPHTADGIHLRPEIRSGQNGKTQKREVIGWPP